jgi:hypothetical protein
MATLPTRASVGSSSRCHDLRRNLTLLARSRTSSWSEAARGHGGYGFWQTCAWPSPSPSGPPCSASVAVAGGGVGVSRSPPEGDHLASGLRSRAALFWIPGGTHVRDREVKGRVAPSSAPVGSPACCSSDRLARAARARRTWPRPGPRLRPAPRAAPPAARRPRCRHPRRRPPCTWTGPPPRSPRRSRARPGSGPARCARPSESGR